MQKNDLPNSRPFVVSTLQMNGLVVFLKQKSKIILNQLLDNSQFIYFRHGTSFKDIGMATPELGSQSVCEAFRLCSILSAAQF